MLAEESNESEAFESEDPDNADDDEDDDEYGDYEEEWIAAEDISYRSVFIYKEFDDKLNDSVKSAKDADDVKNEIILRLLTLKPGEIDLWLNNKHGFQVPCKNGKVFYRKRSPKGSNINKLNRFLVCKGSQVNRQGIEDEDIVLLTYLDESMHEKGDYQNYANLIADYLEVAEDEEFIYIDKVKKAGNFDIVYKSSLQKGQHRLEFIPVLDSYQTRILDNELLVTPPCVIYGSAGTGKTLLSEELYERLIETNPDADILYLTYMPRLKNQVVADLKKRNVDKALALDIDSLVLDNIKALKKHRGNYKKEDYFKEWVARNKDRKNFKLSIIDSDDDMAINMAYIFYRTYSFTSSMETEETFMSSLKKEGGLEDRQKKAIYKICLEYQKHIQDSAYYTDNNAAIELRNSNLKKYDAVIVDEIQDLTQLQVECLLSLLKDQNGNPNRHIFAFGDDNQSINPTLLRLSKADELIHKHYGEYHGEPIVLNGSYRSTDYLIKYINYINKVRSNIIGKDKDFNDQEQRSKIQTIYGNESDKPAFITNKQVLRNGLTDDSLLELNDIMIIVPNEKEYDKLLKQYPQLVTDSNTNLMTIERTKGGEWDTVILYNFFSSTSDIWKQFVDLYEDETAASLKSTVHRMYFNRFYVGLTRASKKVIIAEPNGLDKDIKRVFLPDKISVGSQSVSVFSQINTETEFASFFKNDYTHDVWFTKAAEKYRIHDYEMAFDYIGKAFRAFNNSADSDKDDIRHNYRVAQQKYEIWRDLSRVDELDKSTADVYLEVSFEDEDMNTITEVYKKSTQGNKVPLINADISNDPGDYLKLYEKLKEKVGFASFETDYYDLKSIKAYKQIIEQRLKGW